MVGLAAGAASSFRSALRPGLTEAILHPAVPRTLWAERLSEYKRRKSAATRGPLGLAPAAPSVAGGRNWLPLGPTVVLDGQTGGNQPVGGRVVGLAVGAGGQVLYAATAAGGVFRSEDGATSWRSLMDGFDVDPTHFASASLACGAIAVDPNDLNRVYVGTGEGETYQIFKSRIIGALPAYRGIGPIRSDDGGQTWVTEATAPGAPSLEGEAFFALAIDPRDRDHVIAATTAGLYDRTVAGGSPTWTPRHQPGVYCSVVGAGTGNSVRFFAAAWGQGVLQSTDGVSWTALGTGFPANAGRITLGVQRGDSNTVYALIAQQGTGTLLGVYRLDMTDQKWKVIANPPAVLPVNNGQSQGDYDLALAVDPTDKTILYMGGSYDQDGASVWRGQVQAKGTGWTFANTASIGNHAHADVHVLVHSPADPNELWCGSDGGVFLNRAPRAGGDFAGVNAGLACLCSNFIAQHPTDPNVMFTGLQDNGTARTGGGPLWTHVNYGDGGYCLVHWNDPQRVLSFANGTVYRSDSGGATHGDWKVTWNFGWATMTQPIVTTPVNAKKTADADLVAVGAGADVYVSRDFTNSWKQADVIVLPGLAAGDSVFALAFASANRLFAGTTSGRVYRADWSGTAWSVARLDNAVASPLGLTGLITDVEVDWADATLNALYVAFGGLGDRRRVWHFDGTQWSSRSGAPGKDLLDVEHNALAVDPTAPNNVYVGADIGVWHSADAGLTWEPLENGLPDAPVFDLQIHPSRRLLRAATYGRGVYELALP
jgi:hypothetical protein